MKHEFLDQVELLIATYQQLSGTERQRLDELVDHVTAILYEVLHNDEIAGIRDVTMLSYPSGPRVLH